MRHADLDFNLRQTLLGAMGVALDEPALVLFDRQSTLARALTAAYCRVLCEATALDLGALDEEALVEAIDARPSDSLVVLVQSSLGPPGRFRLRVELFRRALRVLEHNHLSRVSPDQEETYVASLAYDSGWIRGAGAWLRDRLAAAQQVILEHDDARLVFEGPFEPATLNVGDYTGLANRGGLFPIGEVFTEAVDLRAVTGTADLFAFTDQDFRATFPETPVRIRVEGGLVIDAPGAPLAFQSVLDQIRAEETVLIRELGFGLNRALTRTRRVSAVLAYERMCGVHLSLGHKHAVYGRKGKEPSRGKYHVDVFVALDRALFDEEPVYTAGEYHFPPS